MSDNEDTLVPEAAGILDEEVGRIARAVGAHIVAGYLDVPQERLIRMTVVRGLPGEAAWPWSRVARAAQVPVAEAVRTRRPIWIGGQQELARRFPRTAVYFPYNVAIYVAPLVDADVCWGAVLLLWPGTRPPQLSADEEGEVAAACRRAAQALRRAAEAGTPVSARSEPLVLEPPSGSDGPPGRMLGRLPGHIFELDLTGRLIYLEDRTSELLGYGRDELLHRYPGEVLAWLRDTGFESAYLTALFSRLPSVFRVRSPEGMWLSFTLYADDWGLTCTVAPVEGADEGRPPGERPRPSDAPVHVSAVFRLLQLASALAEAKTVQDVTDRLAEQVMPVLGTQGFALVTAEEGRLRVASTCGFPARIAGFIDGMPMSSRTEGVRTIESGTASFHSDSASLLDTYPHVELYGDMAAWAFLPLTVSGSTFGCCVLGYDRFHSFAPGERAELVSLAGMIAQALERARLYDLNVGETQDFQAGLLPSQLPSIPGLHTAARYRPATSTLDVGGDFYDLIRLADDRAAAVVGDVQGHSVQAAALMGQVRTAVHTHAQVGAPPAEALARTNRLLDDLNTERFASCVYAQLDPGRERALLAAAGHPPPILRLPDGRTEVLDLPPGLLLGVDPDTSFEATEIALPHGSLLALYTDGLVERPGADLGDGIADLARGIAEAPPMPVEDLCDKLISRAGPAAAENGDDIAFLLLKTSSTAGS